jgi:monoamine oxidase
MHSAFYVVIKLIYAEGTMTSEPDGAATHETARTTDAVIVGAGLSGLYMLHRLRQMGLSAVVLLPRT